MNPLHRYRHLALFTFLACIPTTSFAQANRLVAEPAPTELYFGEQSSGIETTHVLVEPFEGTVHELTEISSGGGRPSRITKRIALYAGVRANAEHVNAHHRKTVDNTVSNNNSLQKGNIYHDSNSESKTALAGGLFAGLRLNLDAGRGVYVSAEIDGQLHTGAISGALPGVGQSSGRNQYGESWPDDWTFERRRSYGAMIRLGITPTFLNPSGSSGTSIYALGGVRLLATKLAVDFLGCPDPFNLCQAGEFEAGSYSREDDFFGWAGGIGLEKMLGGRWAVRGEIAHTRYGEQKWISFTEERDVRVPASLEGNKTEFSLGMLIYF